MINKILIIINICLCLTLLIISSCNTTFFNKTINIKDNKTNEISNLELEEYVIGVVAAEMPASFNIEALKAQAVAARTYAMYKIENNNKNYDVVTDVSDQSYITHEEMKIKWQKDYEKYFEKIKQAVLDTKNLVLKYNNKVIKSYYFSMSNGYTEDVSLVFGEKRNYLKSVESIYENNTLKNFEVEKEFTKEEICEKLEIRCDRLEFKNIKRSKTLRVITLEVNEKEISGTTFRKKLGLRSTDFNINISDNLIKITTKGYGHGVGMSQYGANGMAKAGYNYEEILKYFYQNTEISSI